MENERAASITIGGKEYELVLTTGATKQIAKRYGGLASLGDKLMKAENFENALDELIWLITLLANQSIMINNFQHPENKRDPLTEETIELLTSPLELTAYKDAIMESMFKGTKRFVESEPEQEKNASAG